MAPSIDERGSSGIKTRILIVSDTHGAGPSPTPTLPNHKRTPFHTPLPKVDVLLHCGDMTMVGHLEEYQNTLDWLSEIDAELKLVIAGNHDISLDEEYWHRKGHKMQRLKEPNPDLPRLAKEMLNGEEARKIGVRYLEEGVHEFVLKSGAKLRVYASPYQPEFCDWAFPYFRHEDRFNPPEHVPPTASPIAENPIPDFPAIDVLMTHGPPFGRLDRTHRHESVGCEHLLRAARRCRPRLHAFGHIHEGWGVDRVVWRGEPGGPVDGEWQNHVEKAEAIPVDANKMFEEKGVYVDVSSDAGDRELVFGKETLMVNASVMTVRYQPLQGPWVVDLDLDRA
ncbi:ser/Thr protein phosphatase family protein [Delitschia confertaspora ATCC 74209]|uniref:Ser/Thr protein phosphatase family protein n=1 Tax=Delitschia confertaspora ATCC 74209 TaxID=1513339 RepID=A0A9P4MS29_9PLEO|nr:ser/Thr protein phosphatase family protein [Delitschia confertaspora ATCC 74209]